MVPLHGSSEKQGSACLEGEQEGVLAGAYALASNMARIDGASTGVGGDSTAAAVRWVQREKRLRDRISRDAGDTSTGNATDVAPLLAAFMAEQGFACEDGWWVSGDSPCCG